MKSRRCFLKTAIFTGGILAGLGVDPATLAQDDTGTADEDRQYLQFARQVMRERAVLFAKLKEQYGPEILDAVEKNTIEETAKRLAGADLPGRDLDAVMTELWNHLTGLIEFEVVEKTEGTLRLKVHKCPWAEEFRKLDAGDIGYAFHCAYDIGFCMGLNPAITFTRTKTLMKGDDCCNHTYELNIE